MADGIGLSVGAATLRGVVVDRTAVTRTAVLTLYPHRPPEVGLPAENPNLAERGLIINDFVDRVGDPVGIVASDGSSHRADALLGDALRATLYAVTRGQPPAGPVGVAHPAHWGPAAVAALRGALAAIPEFGAAHPPSLRSPQAPLVSDAVAALTALQRDPGVPARGIIAVCDFGATGTSVTLADAAHGFAPLAPTVRYTDLSGDLIDQALLTHVLADLSAAGAVDLSGTSAIGSLSKLRSQCRGAKERLSTAAVASMPAELPGRSGEVRVTRNELDDTIRGPLAGFIEELRDALQRSGVRPGDLVAVASIGGGARIPLITTTLSEHLRVPVVTSAQPELAAAIGAGLRAVRGTVEEGATSIAVLPPVAVQAESLAPAALAWSDAQDLPAVAEYADVPAAAHEAGPRPQLAFDAPDDDDPLVVAPVPWYRTPTAVMTAGVVVLLAAIAGAVVLLTGRGDEPKPSVITGTTTSSTPTTTASAPAPAPPPAPPPVTETRTETRRPAPPATVTQTQPPPPPPPTSEPPPPPPTTEPPPPTTEPPPWSPTPPYPTIPGLPWVPLPGGQPQPVPAVP
ncbi:molecular chaperone [Mycolicibacterium sp. P9-64]|uniref:Hsp70 family protein n=1 Tax=Mycolicibacterium sp. P9-64 TaxID=2024612 RepID=UPI0011ED2797|nr:Hsp70 family protein [Mycolicibacterium sp. P9-64]KAA0083548.1 molecular chaperone [Mycolicibacterium sp. P9-64]